MVQLIDTKIAHGFDARAEDLGRDADGEAIYQPAAKKRCYELSPSVRQHRRGERRAQSAVHDDTQGVVSGYKPDRKAWVVLACRAGADHDRIVLRAQGVGEAQRLRGANPTRTTANACQTPIERLGIAHGYGGTIHLSHHSFPAPKISTVRPTRLYIATYIYHTMLNKSGPETSSTADESYPDQPLLDY